MLVLRKQKDYLNKRVAIDKRNNRMAAYDIALYHNRLIDEVVTEHKSSPDKPIPKSMIWSELAILNKPHVYSMYNQILNDKYTNNDAFTKLLVKNKANDELGRIVEAELERTVKNIDYCKSILNKYEIVVDEYKNAVKSQENASMANRGQILKSLAEKSNEMLINEGLNIRPHVFQYRNIELTAESLHRQMQMKSKYEHAQLINEKRLSEGKNELLTKKIWLVTHEGKTTRHMSNHEQKVGLNEKFLIINDANGDMDEMEHPSDPNASYSNAYICYCECAYSNEDGSIIINF